MLIMTITCIHLFLMYFIIIIITSNAKGDTDEWVEKKRKKDEDSILTKTGGCGYINDTMVW